MKIKYITLLIVFIFSIITDVNIFADTTTIKSIGYINLKSVKNEINGKISSDKKRRMKVIREHSNWSRRVLRFIRVGEVCLDMSEEQVRASWGKEFSMLNLFISGKGKYLCLLYQSDNNFLSVILQNNRVVGWSENSSTPKIGKNINYSSNNEWGL